MPPKFKTRRFASTMLVALALMAAFCAVVAWLRTRKSFAPVSQRVPETSVPLAAHNTTSNVKNETAQAALEEPRIAHRRDADFWPQTAHPIVLRRRTVLPAFELSESERLDRAPHVWLAQFGGPLTAEDKIQLEQSHRIAALFPSAEMGYYVRAAAADLAEAAKHSTPALLGWARLEPADKFLAAGLPAGTAKARLRIQLYPGGELKRVVERSESTGAKVLRKGPNWLEVERENADGLALALADLDDVYVVEPVRPKYVMNNIESETNSDATPLFVAPYNLTGAAITVMVRDEARIYAHPDFGTRLLFGPDVAGEQPVTHSTHVAGTIGGDGSSIPGIGAAGFAPSSTIVSYDLNGDEVAEPLQAFQNFGAVLSNHSYGFATGWDDDTGLFTDNQATFGLYGTFALNWDSLVRTQNLILIKAAGNLRDGNGAGHPHNGILASDGDYYDTVDESGASKNVLVVGAANNDCVAGTPDSSEMVLPFSSSGPLSDGRLRPEIIAYGDTLLSCDNTPVTGNIYVSLTGTSMAAASVTGTTALFLQRYQQRFGVGAFCAPHYLRAVYAQTATDMGRPGPDYLHGFGMLDASAAIALFDADAGTGTRIVSSSISAATPERFFLMTSDGSSPIKGTLCWSDDPGDALAQKALVNDLDLRLIKAADQTTSFPFTLNPALPANPAVPGINSVDTIEQVIFTPVPAGNYLFAVRGTTLVSTMPFALASSNALTEVLPPTPVIGTSGNIGQPPFVVNFSGSGSSAAPGASIAQYIWSFGDGSSAQGVNVQHVYLSGTFQAQLKVIDSFGASASTSVIIAVNDIPPIAVLSVSPSSGASPLNVLFSADGSTDPDGQIVSYAMDFGDGTTGAGSSVAHTYAASGLYLATLTVTDNGNVSTSTTANVFVGQPFLPSSGSFSLNFAKTGMDTFSIATKQLGIAPNVVTAGLSGTVSIGFASYDFILDYKGAYHSPGLNVQLTPLKAILTIKIAKTNLRGALSGAGIKSITVKGQRVYVPFAVTFGNGDAFGSVALPYNYTAKVNVKGTGTFAKKP